MLPTDQSRLAIEEIAILQKQGILLESNSPGMLRVSASFLMPSTAASRLPAETTSIHLPMLPIRIDQSVEIPAALHSAEALAHVGFQDSTATEIFKHYQARSNSNHDQDELMEHVEVAVIKMRDSANDPACRNLADNEILERIGIKQAMIDAVLDPEYASDRGAAKLEVRLMEMLHTNYGALSKQLSTLKQQAILFIALTRHEERLRVHDPVDGSSSSASAPDLSHNSG